MSDGIVLEVFGGPGGLSEGARMVGIRHLVGLELDKWACATRAAAGHRTLRADVSGFDVSRLAGRVKAVCGSPPCVTWSAAGKRAGVAVTDVTDALIRDLFDGGKTRAAHRREMARMLTLSWWPDPKFTHEKRSAAIWKAVRSASLVAEPARYIAACDPEWVALEQVPAVLPLWQVYAEELRARGYSAWAGLLNAADYGVPQTRIRAVLIASRTHEVRRPYPTHYDQRKGAQLFGSPWVTMSAALGWGADSRPSPAVTAGGTATGGAEPFGHRDRDALEAERDAGRWTLRAGWSDHGYRMSPERGPNESAPTITAKARSWVLRAPFGQPRADESPVDSVRITPEEAAALQSFPPAYPFQGARTATFSQIGNAFPPLLAAHVLAMAAGIEWEANAA